MLNAPTRAPQLGDFDRGLEMRLAAKVAAAIAETSNTRPLETIAALVAVLGHVIGRTPGLVDAPRKAMSAVMLLLIKNIISAVRVAARAHCNGRAPR